MIKAFIEYVPCLFSSAATIERILRAFNVSEAREGGRRTPLIRGVVGHGWYKDWADYVTEDTQTYK
jgi:hypothetical protein